MSYFRKRLVLDVPVQTLYQWHARPGAFERLTPPWEPVSLVADSGEGIDAHKWMKLRLGTLPVYWLARHRAALENQCFVDLQAQGPFAYWQHQHLFESLGPSQSALIDAVEYRLPVEPFSQVAQGLIQQRLNRMFAYRHRITRQDILTHEHYQKANPQPMNILISGASGVIGSALVPFLRTGGHRVYTLVRHRPQQAHEIQWDVSRQHLQVEDLEPLALDAVIHLAGESIMGRWSPEKKQRILDSRVQGTRLLVRTLEQLQHKPKTFVCASATGIYGDRQAETLTEQSAPGAGFLASVCEAWEAEAQAASTFARVVLARTGIVLTPQGGALAQMLLPFQMGVGGKLGSGQQYMSWVTLDDILRAFYHVLYTDTLQGPVNFTAPTPVKNKHFTQVLSQVLHRPAFFQVPEFALQWAMGEMAEELLLSSANAVPEKLTSSGFVFQYPDLRQGLCHVLGRA